MSARTWLGVAGAAAALVWGVLGYFGTKPADYHDYRTTAVHAAESAYDSLSTVRAAVDASLAGRTFDPYLSAVLDDASRAVSGAVAQFAGQAPVDDATAAMRTRLGPVLLAAADSLGDVQRAERSADRDALRRGEATLGRIGDQLDAFVEAYR